MKSKKGRVCMSLVRELRVYIYYLKEKAILWRYYNPEIILVNVHY